MSILSHGRPTPTKPWRLTTPDGASSYTSERKLYDALNDQTDRVASVGTTIEVHHFEGGRWLLWERCLITENSWEPA